MSAPTRGRVAVTPRSLPAGHPVLDRLAAEGFEVVHPAPGRTPTRSEQLAVLPGCVGYLAGVEPIDGELLRACPDLRVIARNGVGVDKVDVDTARELGIAVERAAGANAQGVAELAMALIFTAVRQVAWSDARLKAGDWDRRPGIELADRTLGVIGLGNIGRRVATMASGIGMRVLGHDAHPDSGWRSPAGFTWCDLPTALTRADVVTLHVPPTGRPLLDADRIAAIRPGTVLVNTARAELVDEDALLAALDTGRVAAYAVDTFTAEPPTDLRLVRHERVIATPHIGGFTRESVERAGAEAIDAILRVLRDGAGASTGSRRRRPSGAGTG